MAHLWEMSFQYCLEACQLESEVALCVVEHAGLLKAPKTWILSDESNQNPKSIFNTHQVNKSVDDLKKASRIAQLILDLLSGKVLAPNQQNSEKLSHLLLIMLQLVDSIHSACALRHVVVLFRAHLGILVHAFLEVVCWKFEITDVLVYLSEGDGVILL